MAEFSGIRNENEFYFAHYLTSLMDDELKEVCQTDEMKSAFEKVSKLGLEYHAVAAARDLVNRHRSAAYAEDRKDYLEKLHAFVAKLFDLFPSSRLQQQSMIAFRQNILNIHIQFLHQKFFHSNYTCFFAFCQGDF